MLGLQTAPRVAAKLAHEQSFRLVVLDIVITLMSPMAVGFSEFFPPVGRIDRATKLFGIDKGLDHQNRMTVARLPVLA